MNSKVGKIWKETYFLSGLLDNQKLATILLELCFDL